MFNEQVKISEKSTNNNGGGGEVGIGALEDFFLNASKMNNNVGPSPLAAALFPNAGLQQVQQLLQSQLATGNFNPAQIQHLLQQHSLMSHHHQVSS